MWPALLMSCGVGMILLAVHRAGLVEAPPIHPLLAEIDRLQKEQKEAEESATLHWNGDGEDKPQLHLVGTSER